MSHHIKRYAPRAPWGQHAKMQESPTGQYVEFEAYMELHERLIKAEEEIFILCEGKPRQKYNAPVSIVATVTAE